MPSIANHRARDRCGEEFMVGMALLATEAAAAAEPRDTSHGGRIALPEYREHAANIMRSRSSMPAGRSIGQPILRARMHRADGGRRLSGRRARERGSSRRPGATPASLGSATRSKWLALSKAQVATDARRRTRSGRAARRSRASASIGSLDCTTTRRPCVSAATIGASRSSHRSARSVGVGGARSVRRTVKQPAGRIRSWSAGLQSRRIAPAKANGSAPAHR